LASLVLFIWTAALLCVVAFHIKEEYDNAFQSGMVQARALIDRDNLFRKWIASHGGVYVPVSNTMRPNPYLGEFTNRDVETRDGLALTLVNPSYMSKMLYDLSNKNADSVSKITSLKLINPANAPDDWEQTALQKFENNKADIGELVTIEGEKYIRFIHPLEVDHTCMTCHDKQGYQEGDVRGGLSITLPLKPILKAELSNDKMSVAALLALWIIGFIGIRFLMDRFRGQLEIVSKRDQEIKIAETKVHFLSYYDHNTNLPNKRLFEDRLQQSIIHAERRNEKIAVTVIDIVNFAGICDALEPAREYELTSKIAKKIRKCFRTEDSIASIGRGRLVLFISELEKKEYVIRIIQVSKALLEEPIEIAGRAVFLKAVMGTAVYPNDSTDPQQLMKFAEIAASQNRDQKNSGRLMYSTAMNDLAQEQLKLDTAVRQALNNNEITVCYQPQLEVTSGRLIGAEALIRWIHPEMGLISPEIFIPLAESNDTITLFGKYVAQQACLQAELWRQDLSPSFRIGVNVSAKQFQDPSLIEMIDLILNKSSLPPENLEIEITEGMIMADVDKAIITLQNIKQRGVKIAIDDFGTGYSSLSQLKNLPVDRLKIDRSFIVDIEHDINNRIIIEMISGLAAKMKIEVIAEGIETEAQKEFLLSVGCAQMQGYLFSQPLTAQEFSEFAATYR